MRVTSGQGGTSSNRDEHRDEHGGGPPAAMVDAAEDADLGRRLRWYENRRGAPPLAVVGLVLLTVLTLVFCYGSVRTVLVERRVDLVFCALTAVLIAGCGFLAWFVLRSNRRYLAVHEQGVVFAGDRVAPVAAQWADVVDVRFLTRAGTATVLAIPVTALHTVDVLTIEGDFRIGDSFPDVAEIGDHLLRQVTSRLGPEMAAQIRDGQPLEFDRWSISADGFTVGDWTWEWADIDDVTIHADKLLVRCVDAGPGAIIEIGHERSAAVEAAVRVAQKTARTARRP